MRHGCDVGCDRNATSVTAQVRSVSYISRILRGTDVPMQNRVIQMPESASPMPVPRISQELHVRTFIRPLDRFAVDTAIEQAWRWYGAPHTEPVVLHADDLRALYTDYPYAACTALVVDLQCADEAFAKAGKSAPVGNLTGLLTGWDSGALLISPQRCEVIRDVLETSTFCFGIASADTIDPVALAMTLLREWCAAARLPPLPSSVSRAAFGALDRLPAARRLIILHALRHPAEWSVKRLAMACGITRRTLERDFERCGLPAPGLLLRNALARLHSLERDDEESPGEDCE